MSWTDLTDILKRECTQAAQTGRRGVAAAWRASRSLAVGAASVCSRFKELLASLGTALWTGARTAANGVATRLARQSMPRGPGKELNLGLGRPALSRATAAFITFHPADFSRRVLDRPLLLAFIISILIHCTLYSGWRWGKHLGWWEHQATWLLDLTRAARERAAKPPREESFPPVSREIPLTFVEVDPAMATEPPKDAKYYGAFNSIAANPTPQTEPQPKVEGQQTQIPRVTDNVPLDPQPLQPSPTPAPTEPRTPTPDPQSVQIGMTEARQEERPRTIREAKLQKGLLAGEKMRQTGGVKRPGRVSLDVKATPFGSYDAAFIAAVQQRWYDLIDSTRLMPRTGKVVVVFRLHVDGTITQMTVRETEVGDMLGLLCRRAVEDPAPYPRWPSDMWRMVGKDYRDVVFTFYYN